MTVTTLIGGRETLTKIDSDSRWWVTVLWVLAIIAGAASTYFAYKASIGEPSVRLIRGNSELAALQVSHTQRARSAVQNLRIATGAGAVALGAGVVAVAVLWLAPKAAVDPPQDVQVTKSNDEQLCGELLPASDERYSVRVRKEDGAVRQLAAADVKQVSAVAECK